MEGSWTYEGAKEEDLPLINKLILESKAYWNYSPEYMSEALPLLQLKNDYVNNHTVVVAKQNSEICGVIAFTVEGEDQVMLDHFWLRPSLIGQGLGKRMWQKAQNLARHHHWKQFFIYSEPGAEGFYLKMGAIKVGEKPSRCPHGPLFPVLKYETY